MRNILSLACAVLTISTFANTGRACEDAAKAQGIRTEESIPLIVLENVPLTDAIRNLARQVDMNFILDPRIIGPAGIFRTEPNISYRWENLSAEEALRRVLKDHKLKLVMNPATTVARITGTNNVAPPVPTHWVGIDAKGPIPVMQMDGIPVSEAIKQVSRHTGINILFAPDAQAALDNPNGSRQPLTVSVRWQKITARQALAALLDNYDLILIEQPDKRTAQIALRALAAKVRNLVK